MAVVPKSDNQRVKQLAASLSAESLMTVPCQPLPDKPVLECFRIVPEQVQAHGGKQVTGWTIWEWPNVLIEAEFHAVWQRPDGTLVDITPRTQSFESILFLPDPKKVYRGRQVDNVRRALSDSLLVNRLIQASEELFRAMNKGDLADQHGEIEATPAIIKAYERVAKAHQQVVTKFGI
ncbi:hypothetical protein [Vogesella indigofera]|uniref:hypothetical protein n=1 Tax=Vogesella indigofera TaxID=45465 RepID=UPI00234E8D45|nr:hypothetical protein [Vogesella indigofera]MDC7699567.1 hypothetical protein [Vogesella indigofera]